jgi:hypothetical protein
MPRSDFDLRLSPRLGELAFIGLRLIRPEAGMSWRQGQAYSQDLRERVLGAMVNRAGFPGGRFVWVTRP